MTSKTFGRAIAAIGLSLLMSIDATASERYVLHHDRDAICRTFPCPNWSGMDQRTHAAVEFDTLVGEDAIAPSDRPGFDRQARAGGVLVEGDFTPMSNHLNLNWSSAFYLKRVIRACAAVTDCQN